MPIVFSPIEELLGENPILLIITTLSGPIIEILIGMAMLFAWQLGAVTICCLLLHSGLLLLLGPLGIGYNSVVWPWNIAMFCLVFTTCRTQNSRYSFWQIISQKYIFSKVVVLLYVFAPALHYFNMWDTYPSFALYSGRVVEGYLNFESEQDSVRIAPNLKHIEKGIYPDGIPILYWTLNELNVPSYPEMRTYKKLHKILCQDKLRSGDIKIRILNRANFWEAKRNSEELSCSTPPPHPPESHSTHSARTP